jgi:hypothetical protein
MRKEYRAGVHDIFAVAHVIEVPVRGEGREFRLGYVVQSVVPMELIEKRHDEIIPSIAILLYKLLADCEYA